MRKMGVALSVLLLSLIIFFAAIGLYRQYVLTHFSCTAIMAVSNDTYRLSAIMNLQINGKNGTLAVDGSIIDKQGVSLPLRTILSLRVSQNKNHYTLVNNSFIELFGNQHSAEKIEVFPPFFKEKNAAITFTLYKQGDKGIIFTHDSSIAYCKLDSI